DVQFLRQEPEIFGHSQPSERSPAIPAQAAFAEQPVAAGQASPDPSVIAARVALFDHMTSSTPTAQRHAVPPAPKRSATKAEVVAIQSLMSRARQADADVARLENEAEVMRFYEDEGAVAKEREAHAKRLASRGLKQEAIDAAVSAYGIDVT